MVGVDFVVEGKEKISVPACVYYSKHQSAWETLVFMTVFDPYVWILKREALWIPFFGWGLAGLKAIAINRKAGRSAIEQIKRQGRQRLENGLGIMIFPEGTRVPPGQTKRFGLGGAILAQSAGVPIIPIAHNSGSFWPARHWLVKRPGTIRIIIGDPVYPDERSPEEVTADIKRWMDETVRGLEEGVNVEIVPASLGARGCRIQGSGNRD